MSSSKRCGIVVVLSNRSVVDSMVDNVVDIVSIMDIEKRNPFINVSCIDSSNLDVGNYGGKKCVDNGDSEPGKISDKTTVDDNVVDRK